MGETQESAVKKVVQASERRGKPITDDDAREALSREYNQFLIDSFNPQGPAPDISTEKADRIVEDWLGKH
jgi:hypothetical protein